MDSLRLVARETVSRDDVDDAMRSLSCRLINVVPASATVPAQLVFASADGRTTLHFVHDAHLDEQVFVVASADGAAAAVVERLRAAIDTWGDEEIASLATSVTDAAALVRGLRMTALTAAPSAATLARFSAGFAHPDEAVRAATLIAAAYAGWPGLEPDVVRLAEGDPSPAVRAQATALRPRWQRA
ncbi:MAG: hypothetical protein NVS3B10_29830 [Polyangiales bacterium]